MQARQRGDWGERKKEAGNDRGELEVYGEQHYTALTPLSLKQGIFSAMYYIVR